MTDKKTVSKLVILIVQKYGAERVAFFGARAKNRENETSDYDFTISKRNIQSLFQLASFMNELENAFGVNNDVITDTSSNVEFLEQIKKDKIVVYESKRYGNTGKNNGVLSGDQGVGREGDRVGVRGRPFSRPCCIPGNISASCSWRGILIAVVYILAYYVIEWMQEKRILASDG